jgi:hypothetical protein
LIERPAENVGRFDFDKIANLLLTKAERESLIALI